MVPAYCPMKKNATSAAMIINQVVLLMGFELHPISIGWIVSVRLLLAKMFSFGLGQYGVNRPAQKLHHVGLEAAFPIRR